MTAVIRDVTLRCVPIRQLSSQSWCEGLITGDMLESNVYIPSLEYSVRSFRRKKKNLQYNVHDINSASQNRIG